MDEFNGKIDGPQIIDNLNENLGLQPGRLLSSKLISFNPKWMISDFAKITLDKTFSERRPQIQKHYVVMQENASGDFLFGCLPKTWFGNKIGYLHIKHGKYSNSRDSYTDIGFQTIKNLYLADSISIPQGVYINIIDYTEEGYPVRTRTNTINGKPATSNMNPVLNISFPTTCFLTLTKEPRINQQPTIKPTSLEKLFSSNVQIL